MSVCREPVLEIADLQQDRPPIRIHAGICEVVWNIVETGNAKCFRPPFLPLHESFKLTIRLLYKRVQLSVGKCIAHQSFNSPALGVVFFEEATTLIIASCLVNEAGY